ncbi:hypothetical protein C8R43DRAFT_543572 [Mycena crocata]|nr:hypothetical protein C8R43DRAFT_543572 [Mycena crocata]
MSQATLLSAEILAYRTCSACYKSENKKIKFRRCGACQKAAYCSVDCQKKDWKNHKTRCHLQAQNREALPTRGTPERDLLSDIKKWFAKHTQLLVYCAMHAMQPHDPARISQIKTHMLLLKLDPAPGDNRGEFVFKSAAIVRMSDRGLDDATCAALAGRADDAARDRRYSLTMYVQSGVSVYLAPITIERCGPIEHLVRFGLPDGNWKDFLERAINKDLKAEDEVRIKRMQEIV